MTAALYQKEDVVGYECRHVVHCDPRDWSIPDLHFVKEIVHLKDGRRLPKTRRIVNYQRPFWVSTPGVQMLHKQKKEREKQENLIRYECAQRDLVSSIARALRDKDGRTPNDRCSLKQMCRSPYVYGADILSTAIIKKEYQTRFPKCESPYSVCALDIESDMIEGTKQILMNTIAMGNKAHTIIDRFYFRGYVASEDVWREKLRAKMEECAKEFSTNRQLEWEIEFVDSPAQIVIQTFKKLHEWQPDILAIWNMDFDVPKMVEALEAANIRPADIFSDPSVPKPYKFYKYRQGSAQKVMANGKVTPVSPEDRWHTASFPASFYIIDAMCAYRGIRNQKPRAGSYSLDNILNLEIGVGKLKFEEADHLHGGDWHTFMQDKFPFEYVIYNVFDVVRMLELDEKTMDLSAALPKSAKHSDFQHFRSQPRRLVNDFHYTCLDSGYVIGTTSDQMIVPDIDNHVIGTDDWISALPAFMIAEAGMPLTVQQEGQLWRVVSSIYAQVADLDVSAAYPTNEVVANICQETTFRELGTIDGVSEEVRRAQGINLSAGFTNAVEFSVNMFHVPDFMTLLAEYEAHTTPNTVNGLVRDLEQIMETVVADASDVITTDEVLLETT